MSAFTQLLKVLSAGKNLLADKNPAAGFGAQTLGKVLPYSEETILSNVRNNAVDMLKRAEKASTGFTFDPRRGTFLEPGKQSGSMMASVPNLPGQSSGAGTVQSIDELIATAKKPEVMSRLQREEYLGGWNPEGDGVGLDPSRRFLTEFGALKSGLDTKQMSGFSLLRNRGYEVTPGELSNARNRLLKNTSLATALGGGAVASGGYISTDENSEGLGDISKLALIPLLVGGTAYAALRNPASLKGAANIDILTGGLAGTAEKAASATPGLISKQAKKLILPQSNILKLLKDVTSVKPEGSTIPSALSKTITDTLNKQVKVINGTTRKSLIMNVKNKDEYSDELRSIGLKPITNNDYMNSTGLLKVDKNIAVKEMEENIESLLDVGGYAGFYDDMPNQLLKLSKGELPLEQIAGISGTFSAGASVPNQMKFTKSFLANPTEYPSGLVGSDAWNKALRVTTNSNPLDPLNFNNQGNLVKTGSFARNMTNDAKFDMNVTADRHAVMAALGVRFDKMPDMSNQEIYDLFVNAFNNVGLKRGMTGREVQAEAWDVWRKIMMKDAGSTNLSLFTEPGIINPVFKLDPLERKEVFSKKFIEQGRDSKFLKNSGLLS